MKKRDTRLILFIAVPVLIVALGILFVQVYLRSAVPGYVENTLEEEIGSHLDQASSDVLDVNVQKRKFNAFPITVSTPGISLYAAIDVYNEERRIQTGQIRFKGREELSGNDSNGFENLIFENHSFRVANLSVYLPEVLFSYHIDSISLDGSMNTISMENSKILPDHPKAELYRYVDYGTFNPAIYPLASSKMADGVHKSSLFLFAGNDVESSGALYMEWNDLMLIFTPEAGDLITGITQSFGKIIYHQSNPYSADKYPAGDIDYEWDVRRLVFHDRWN